MCCYFVFFTFSRSLSMFLKGCRFLFVFSVYLSIFVLYITFDIIVICVFSFSLSLYVFIFVCHSLSIYFSIYLSIPSLISSLLLILIIPCSVSYISSWFHAHNCFRHSWYHPLQGWLSHSLSQPTFPLLPRPSLIK